MDSRNGETRWREGQKKIYSAETECNLQTMALKKLSCPRENSHHPKGGKSGRGGKRKWTNIVERRSSRKKCSLQCKKKKG